MPVILSKPKKKIRKFTAEEIATIAKMKQQGFRNKDIALKLGRSVRGIENRSKGMTQPLVTISISKLMKELRSRNLTEKIISEITGYSIGAVRNHTRNMNIPRIRCKGSRITTSKLDEDIVRVVIVPLLKMNYKTREIAARISELYPEIKITKDAIADIARGASWKHVTGNRPIRSILKSRKFNMSGYQKILKLRKVDRLSISKIAMQMGAFYITVSHCLKELDDLGIKSNTDFEMVLSGKNN